MGSEIKAGDTVRIKRGICGEGYTFVVASVHPGHVPGHPGIYGAQVYGQNYGPVLACNVTVVRQKG